MVAYWVAAIAGQRRNELFKQGTAAAWAWAKPAAFIRWFTDGERRYGKELWKLASVILKPSEIPANYGYRKVWQFGLEVAMKISGCAPVGFPRRARAAIADGKIFMQRSFVTCNES